MGLGVVYYLYLCWEVFLLCSLSGTDEPHMPDTREVLSHTVR